MRTRSRAMVVGLFLAGCSGDDPVVRVGTPCPAVVIAEVNDHWIATHPNPGDNRWERATYFIGDMAAYQALGDPAYLDYARAWAEQHGYHLNGGIGTRNADNHLAGQVYLTLNELEPDPAKIADITASIDNVVERGARGDWSWIDAQFMASAAYAHLAVTHDDAGYADAMHELYVDARDRRALYDAGEGLWYRDENYLYPATQTPYGEKVFWSRGNGWVIGALALTLAELPDTSPHLTDYGDMLVAMASALAAAQRSDGLWNVSLADPQDLPGPESSGTSLFIFGLAYGINEGYLDGAIYTPIVEHAWRGLVATAVRADGELGFVQGVGERPDSSQPVTLSSTHDYGVGAFLLAGSEMHRLGLDLECPR